jgi:DNA-binding XRE family transcriptional regulator
MIDYANGGLPRAIKTARDVSIELRAWRATMQYSQHQAAGHLGVPVESIIEWEKGAPCPFANMLETSIGVPLAPVRFRQ